MTAKLYAPPRSDYPNEGTGPHGRKYIADWQVELEKYLPQQPLWVCEFCDALNAAERETCAECGAGRELEC